MQIEVILSKFEKMHYISKITKQNKDTTENEKSKCEQITYPNYLSSIISRSFRNT